MRSLTEKDISENWEYESSFVKGGHLVNSGKEAL